jgi:hypothetical protein
MTLILRVVRAGILVDKVALKQILLPKYFLYPCQNPYPFNIIIL